MIAAPTMPLSSPFIQRHADFVLAGAVFVVFALSCLISYALTSASSATAGTATTEANAISRSAKTDAQQPKTGTNHRGGFSITRFLVSVPFIFLGLISLAVVVLTVFGSPGYDRGLVRLMLIPTIVFLTSGAGIAMSKGWSGFLISLAGGGLLLLVIWGIAVFIHAAIWSR